MLNGSLAPVNYFHLGTTEELRRTFHHCTRHNGVKSWQDCLTMHTVISGTTEFGTVILLHIYIHGFVKENVNIVLQLHGGQESQSTY